MLSNARVRAEHVPEPQFEGAVDWRRRERPTLAIQDTTMLNHGGPRGLDAVGGGRGAKGILADCGVAAVGVGWSPGLFCMDVGFRRRRGRAAPTGSAGWTGRGNLAAACP